MEAILTAVIPVVIIGVICAAVLVIASKVMAVKEDERFPKVRECLPGANCGACGFAGCDGYAKALCENPDTPTNLCIPGADGVSRQLSEVLGVEFADVVEQVAVVHCSGDCAHTQDKVQYEGIESCTAAKLMYGGKGSCTYGCLGLGDCAKVCPQDAVCNPSSDIPDIEALAKIAHEAGIPLVIDNTFGTPYLIRPIEYGADIVVHSATKFIGGHGTTLGGVIVDSGNFDWAASGKYPWISEPNPSYHGVKFTDAAGKAAFAVYIRAILLRDTGATISPVHSFIFLQGLETLSLRVERHVDNALKVVDYLSKQPLVEKVNHPSISTDPTQQELYKKYFPNGGGSIFTFEIKGDAKKAQEFIDNLELFSLLANVADVKSLAIHPASTTHSECNEEELLDQGIKPNTIRLSIGTENIDDIIEDLDEAFKAIS